MAIFPPQHDPAPAEWSARLPLGIGILALVLLAAGLGTWSVQARLASVVISPGTVQVVAQDLMDIVPADSPLMVMARVEAVYIDDISAGQEVFLRLPGFDQRHQDPIPGRVTKISAEKVLEGATGLFHYPIEIRPNQGDLDGVLRPGTPVEAHIKTGDQTAFSLLIDPLRGFSRRAFRE